jgi:phosphoribosylaminoimidazolecarboxamide formyltransferase/IMP cyclohydrolase
MIRAAAKNYQDVLVITDPADYKEVITRLKNNEADKTFRLNLMYKTFLHTAVYDSLISEYLREQLKIDMPDSLALAYEKKQEMRYGENPHQNAAFYKELLPVVGSLTESIQLNGKELSFNNINDANGALMCLYEFDEPAVVAVKHANPCGVGTGKTIYEAYMAAYECDPKSIFGGIVALNRKVDKKTAEEMVKIFLEIIIAPDYDKDALEILSSKPSLRVLKLDIEAGKDKSYTDMKKVYGGLLVQEGDIGTFTKEDINVVTKTKPTAKDLEQLAFAFKVVKHVKSNAIVIAKDNTTIGIGCGQTNRIWACQQAIEHAGNKTQGAYLASDAFFPFSDCVEECKKAGIKAIIQPGGSRNDAESIAACDKYGIAMVFVGKRHFRH